MGLKRNFLESLLEMVFAEIKNKKSKNFRTKVDFEKFDLRNLAKQVLYSERA